MRRDIKTFYAVLPGRHIYNGCAPDHIYLWTSRYKERWWKDEFAELRELVVQWFRHHFEHFTGGHYSRLRESVLRHGFQNPIIVTAGKSLRRESWQLPPDYPQKYVCEQNGGSRLALAHELNMEIPCVINGDVPGEELFTLEDVYEKFTDKTYQLKRCSVQGVSSMPRNLSHLGQFSMRENKNAVHLAKEHTIQQLDDWIAKHGEPDK